MAELCLSWTSLTQWDLPVRLQEFPAALAASAPECWGIAGAAAEPAQGQGGLCWRGTSPTSHAGDSSSRVCQAWLHSGNAAGQSSVSMSTPRASRVVLQTVQRIPEVGKDLGGHQRDPEKPPLLPPICILPSPAHPWLAGSCPFLLELLLILVGLCHLLRRFLWQRLLIPSPLWNR